MPLGTKSDNFCDEPRLTGWGHVVERATWTYSAIPEGFVPQCDAMKVFRVVQVRNPCLQHLSSAGDHSAQAAREVSGEDTRSFRAEKYMLR